MLRARISESGLTAPCQLKVAMPLSKTLTEISTSVTLEVSRPLVARGLPDWRAMRASLGCSATRASLGCSASPDCRRFGDSPACRRTAEAAVR